MTSFTSGRSRTEVGLGLCLFLAATTVPAGPLQLPALSQPATGEHHPGKVIWIDLVTPDLARAKSFYGDLFGWTFTDMPSGSPHYALAKLNGHPVAGLVERRITTDVPRQPAWLTFIAIQDVDRAQQQLVSLGGKVLAPARTYEHRGRQAVFADPQGAVFAVLQSSSGDPQDVLAEPGEWIWSSLIAHDPGTDAAFYQTMFGYEIFDLPSDNATEHLLFATDDYARASANALPSTVAGMHPHWLNFVRVTDTAAAAGKVESLGGRILVAPHPDRHGGLIAVAADPAGAPFGLLEWSETDTKRVSP